MKKVFFLSLFFIAGSLSMQAQCAHSAKKSCHKKTELSSQSAAMVSASADESILVKKSISTGENCFVRKEICPHSGSVKLVNVVFDEKTKTFVNQAPDESAMNIADHSDQVLTPHHCTEAMKAACKKVCSPEMKAACAKKCAKMKSSSQVSEVSPVQKKQIRS